MHLCNKKVTKNDTLRCMKRILSIVVCNISTPVQVPKIGVALLRVRSDGSECRVFNTSLRRLGYPKLELLRVLGSASPGCPRFALVGEGIRCVTSISSGK